MRTITTRTPRRRACHGTRKGATRALTATRGAPTCASPSLCERSSRKRRLCGTRRCSSLAMDRMTSVLPRTRGRRRRGVPHCVGLEHNSHLQVARVTRIHSNRYLYDAATRTSSLEWYEKAPHGCTNDCAPNLCKSTAVRRIIRESALVNPVVVYGGDGWNDLCPYMDGVRVRDHFFGRANYSFHQRLLKEDQESSSHASYLRAQLHLWEDSEALVRGVREVLVVPSAVLPPLMLFQDDPSNTFRRGTLAKRLPALLRRAVRNCTTYFPGFPTSDVAARLEKLRNAVERDGVFVLLIFLI